LTSLQTFSRRDVIVTEVEEKEGETERLEENRDNAGSGVDTVDVRLGPTTSSCSTGEEEEEEEEEGEEEDD
jgi:hypothetical protein